MASLPAGSRCGYLSRELWITRPQLWITLWKTLWKTPESPRYPQSYPQWIHSFPQVIHIETPDP